MKIQGLIPEGSDLSDELSKIVDPGNYEFLAPRDLEGRIRVAYFTGTNKDAPEEVGVAVLPKGARLLGGNIRGYLSSTEAAVLNLEVRVVCPVCDTSVPACEEKLMSEGGVTLSFCLGLGYNLSAHGKVLPNDGLLLVKAEQTGSDFGQLRYVGEIFYVVD